MATLAVMKCAGCCAAIVVFYCRLAGRTAANSATCTGSDGPAQMRQADQQIMSAFSFCKTALLSMWEAAHICAMLPACVASARQSSPQHPRGCNKNISSFADRPTTIRSISSFVSSSIQAWLM